MEGEGASGTEIAFAGALPQVGGVTMGAESSGKESGSGIDAQAVASPPVSLAVAPDEILVQ